MNIQLPTNTKVLTKEDFREQAPAVLTRQAAPKMSERYNHFSTWKIISDLQKKGYFPVAVKQSGAYKKKDLRFAKHMIRFREEQYLNKTVGDVFVELALVNSHNGASSYQLFMALWRKVCGNGLVVMIDSFHKVRLNHMSYSLKEISKVTSQYAKALPNVLGEVNLLKSAKLDKLDKIQFASQAIELRYKGCAAEQRPTMDVGDVLAPQRTADQGNSLWKVFNVVQENLVKGGIPSRSIKNKVRKLRALNNIGGDIRFNQDLWELATHYAQN